MVRELRHAKLEQQQIWTTTFVAGARLENEAGLTISTELTNMLNNGLIFRFSDNKVKIALEEIGVVWERSPRIINQNLDHPRK